jgi:hypothetical protein
MDYTAKGLDINIEAVRSGDEIDRANELADILLQHQINNAQLVVPTIAKGWVCKLPSCNNELDSKRLFCDGHCATLFSQR